MGYDKVPFAFSDTIRHRMMIDEPLPSRRKWILVPSSLELSSTKNFCTVKWINQFSLLFGIFDFDTEV